MPWTNSNFPDSMKNLLEEVRNKAIEIANTLLEEKSMEEGIAIATAISKAKDWAANRGKKVENPEKSSISDAKEHGKVRYVIPYFKEWAVKEEGNENVEKKVSYNPRRRAAKQTQNK